MKPSRLSFHHWHMRFAIRIAFYGLALGIVLWSTASSFDSTEITAWLFFLALAIGFEGVLAVLGGQWPAKRPPSRSGSIRTALAFPLALFLTMPALELLPRPIAEVVTRGTFDEHERAVLRAFQ